MVKRFDCLKLLASWMDEHMLTVTSRGGNAREWAHLRPRTNTFGAVAGVSLAFPKRKVVAIDSDGSLLLDTSALVTVADVNPPNMLILVFDNQAYANMGATATARGADLEKMARGAGIKKTGTISTLEDFGAAVKKAMEAPELAFYVVKVLPGRERVKVDSRFIHGRPMLENFVTAVRSHPDYRGGFSPAKD